MRRSSLTANGNVFIINTNGITFGSGAQVNVGGLVASTLALSDAAFLAGLAAGLWSGLDEIAATWRLDRRFEPRMDEAERQRRITRWRDNSLLSSASVPRVKVEYQLSRPLFLRFVGQYDNRQRDALRDPVTDQPLVINSTLAGRQVTRDFRVDWLVSYLPSPGTVVFAGYGASLTEPEAFRFRDLERVRDGFFFKLSYVFRP